MDNLITEVDILSESKECFLVYAEEVLTDRAIPSAEDGLLSVQRKILWTMEEILKMDNKSKTKKSASVVGSTLASAYFHGDASCYGALCKMAQQYLMRYPLIEGQGSLGSQEANGLQASARYTEAKPSQYTDLMMLDYKKNVVPVVETYNNEYYEPVVLPALFPNALVNGREAIGVSMAHNSSPMNLTEVCEGIIEYIKNRNISVKELMNWIKGPDFPLGGVVINQKDIAVAFETGRSNTSLKVRGDYIIEGNKIIFTSIPYRTYRNKIKEQINDNIEELDKVIEDFDDESNVGNNRLVFYVRKGIPAETAVAKLFALTDLQTTISYNMNFIVNGTPKLCSLKDLIQAYVDHQISVILQATEYDKAKAEARAHVIRGLLVAIDKIDEVIALIKASESKSVAREGLISFLNIDSVQADAILDMKLAKLTRIDKQELVKELQEKEAIIAECIKIITDATYRDSVLIKKIQEMKERYGDARRTRLENITAPKEEKETADVVPENCVVILTEAGSVKRIPTASFKAQKRNGKGAKTQDDIVQAVIRTNSVDSLMVFTDQGRMYRLPIVAIPEGTNVSKGQPINALVNMEIGESPSIIYSVYRDTDAQYVLFATRNGQVKKTSLDEYIKTKKKSGVAAVGLRDADELACVTLVKDEELLVLTEQGMCIHFKSSEVTPTGRITEGVRGIALNEGDKILTVLPVRDSNDQLAVFLEDGRAKQFSLTELPLQKRGGKGLMVCPKGEKVAAAALISNEDNLLICGASSSICIAANDIPTMGRIAAGNQMIKESKVISISKI